MPLSQPLVVPAVRGAALLAAAALPSLPWPSSLWILVSLYVLSSSYTDSSHIGCRAHSDLV